MAPLVQVIGAGVHPDDWMKNYIFLLRRIEALETRLERLEWPHGKPAATPTPRPT